MKKKLLLIVTAVAVLFIPTISFGQAPDLGVTSSFALFTASGAFNGDAATSVTGDIGTNVGAFTPPGFLVGSIHVADPVSAQGAMDVASAYASLAGLTCNSVLTTPLGNAQILTPNIYCISTAAVLNATLILDGQGNPNSIFIFQIDGALSTNSFSNVLLTNSANLCNVYWQINGAFNEGGNTLFQGTVIANGAINLANGATLNGRGLSTAGAISTSANTVFLPAQCECTLDVTCPAATVGNLQCISQIPVGTAADVTVNSSCGVATVTIANSSTGTGCPASPYVLTRTYTVTDEQAHIVSCTATFTVIDNMAPAITCPGPVTVSCTGLVPIASTTSVTVGADNCGGTPNVTLVGDVITGQTCANRFLLTRTYRVTDPCGNAATCSQLITVNDVTAPAITCPGPVTVSCANLVPTANPGSVTTGADNCGGGIPTVTFLNDVVSDQTCANRLTITRYYQVADVCGNTASCSQVITVNDQTVPVLTCPGPVTVSCANLVPAFNPNAATATDLCGGTVTIIQHAADQISNQTCPNRFSVLRSYRATDACGNSANCSQTITVNDQTVPTITCPLNVVVSCASNVPPAAPGTIVASDNCGGAATISVLNDVITGQTCPNRFNILRTYIATDLCGNAAQCNQTISVNDLTGPTLVCPLPVTVQCAGQVPAADPSLVTISDNCGGTGTVLFIGDVQSNLVCANRFMLTRTYQGTDACGNTSNCQQLITVNDQTAPMFMMVPPDVTVDCFAVPVAGTATATDNCNGAVTITYLGEVQTLGICPVIYTLTRSWLATDACGNTAMASQLVSVTDTYAPQFIVEPHSVVVECGPDNQAELQAWLDSNAGAVVEDCGNFTFSYFTSPGITMPSICGNTFQRYIRFVATDQCGNSSYRDVSFVVVDQTPPVFTVLPQDLSIECWASEDGEAYLGDWLDNNAGLIVEDNCGNVTLKITLWDENHFCSNTWEKIYQFKATDECGNVSYAYAKYAVIDVTPPVIECPQGLSLTCPLGITPDLSAVTVSDNCGGVSLAVTHTETSGSGCLYSPMTIVYTITATDECGNTAVCFQTIQVIDSIAPVYTGPAVIEVACLNDLPDAVSAREIVRGLMTDNCFDIICFNAGTTLSGDSSVTFTLKSKDLCGNWTPLFNVTFTATGVCKPICTSPQTVWGLAGGILNGQPVTGLIADYLQANGPLTVGKFSRTMSIADGACVADLLPGAGNSVELPIGNAVTDANCTLPAPLLNFDGTLQNELAANVVALRLNIWYNQHYNQRDLGVQSLATLPSCLVDYAVKKQLGQNGTVKGLLDLSNNYLGSVGYFEPGFGDLLNTAIANLNEYWENCTTNNPCSFVNPFAERDAVTNSGDFSNVHLAPNPAINTTTLRFESTSASELQLSVIGVTGLIRTTRHPVVEGANSLEISLSELPAGVYWLTMQTGLQKQTLRVVKMIE